MPYHIVKRDSKWMVVNADSGERFGTHGSRERARRQVRALRANAGHGGGKVRKKKDR